MITDFFLRVPLLWVQRFQDLLKRLNWVWGPSSVLLLMKNTYPKIYDIPEMKHDCRHCSFQTSIQSFLISPVVALANDWELEFDNWQLTSSKINNSPCVGIREQLRQWKHWGWVGERCRDKLWSMKERAGAEWTQITDWLPTPRAVNEW